ncbi:MAG TPA: HNH endonuclease, partial [Ktedonobacteraceae bacterium]
LPPTSVRALNNGLAGDATPCQIYLDAQTTSLPIRSVVVAGGGRSRKERVTPSSFRSFQASSSLSALGIGSDREEGKSFMAVLVLNSSLQPLSVIPERRLIVLLSKQKVTFVDDSVRQLIEESIQARRLELERPVIVQLLANVRIPRIALQPTRSNILLRDEESCQYCGKRSRELTLDHVVPRSRGGQSTWENLVASCKACNGKKGNRLPKEVNMRLLRQPRPLTQEYAGFFLLRYPKLREAYEEFLLSAQRGISHGLSA